MPPPPSALRAVCALLLAALACGGEAPGSARRLLIVGWDGAGWELVDVLLAEGRLPNLAGLVARGSTAQLVSTVVPISSAAWVGAATGRTPGETGVYGFFEPVPGSYDVRLISSRSSRATPLWRTLGRHGRRSIVFGVPVTYPPEAIEGVVVSGMLAPRDAQYAHPAALTERLRKRGFVPDLGIWRQLGPLSADLVRRQLAVKLKSVLELLAEEDWDLAWIVYKELDVISHRAYDGRAAGPVASLYEALDRQLGALLAAVGPEVRVLLLSDHGFRAYPRRFYLQAWLVESGFAARRAEAPAPTNLPQLPLARQGVIDHRRRIDELDLHRTAAFAGLCEGNFGGVRLNLRGREPRGSVEPARAEDVLARIEAALRSVKVPGTDRPLVVRTWRREDLYPGPHVDLLSDLLFETDPEVAVRSLSNPRAFEHHESEPFPDHTRDGILVTAGPGIAAVGERGRASIFDVAPTALHWLGLPVYEEMDGRVLAELAPSLGPARVVSEASEPRRPEEEHWLSDSWSDPEIEEIEQRLEQLGYVKTP